MNAMGTPEPKEMQAPSVVTPGVVKAEHIGDKGTHAVAASSFDGDVAEIIILDAALNDADRATVEAYLKAKWGTP